VITPQPADLRVCLPYFELAREDAQRIQLSQKETPDIACERRLFNSLRSARRRFYTVLFRHPWIIDRCLRLQSDSITKRAAGGDDAGFLFQSGYGHTDPNAHNSARFVANMTTLRGIMGRARTHRINQKASRILCDLPWNYRFIAHTYADLQAHYSDPPHDLRDYRVLLERRWRQFRDARDLCVVINTRLVYTIVRQFEQSCSRQFSGQLADLIEEGMLGLMRAVDQFNLDFGHKFSTYCTAWVRQYVGRFVDMAAMIRIPGHLRKLVWYLQSDRAVQQMSDQQVAELFDEKVATIHYLRTLTKRQVVSLNGRTIQQDGEITESSLESFIPGREDTVATAIADDRSAQLHQVLEKLPDRERNILCKRYLEGLTLEQVGNLLGITRERVRQLEWKACARMRRYLKQWSPQLVYDVLESSRPNLAKKAHRWSHGRQEREDLARASGLELAVA
jgi:RNA polymerase primary sigma factor